MTRWLQKRLGQHFLIDARLAERIVDALELDPEIDTVVEIGPGRGALTALLARRCRRLVAVELDAGLAGRLRQRFQPQSNIRVVRDDFLKFDLAEIARESKRLRLVGNIPYSITSEIILRTVKRENRMLLYDAVLTLQKEVAERIVAVRGTKSYGILSVLSQALARPKLLFTLPPGAFRPVPKIHSAVVRWSHFDWMRLTAQEERSLRILLRVAFGQRRKMMRNSLAVLGEEMMKALEAAGWDLKKRPEELGPETWAKLARDIAVSRKATDKIGV